MSAIAPGWYKDPAEPTTQRYWDGEGWLGDPLPVDATPPPGPPVMAPQPAPPTPPGLPGEAVDGSPGAQAPVSPGTGVPSGPPAAAHPTSGQPSYGQPANGQPPNGQASGQPSNGGPAYGPPYSGPYGGPYAGPYTGPYGQPPTPWQPGGTGQQPPWAGQAGAAGYLPLPYAHALASPIRRLAARLIDIAAVFLLNVVVNGWFVYQFALEISPFVREYQRRFAAGESTSGLTLPERASTLELTILFVGTALWFAYEVPAIAFSGQTLGKRLMGIRVVSEESAGLIGFRRSWRRWNPMGLPVLLWWCFGIGFVLQFVDSLFVLIDTRVHQALHDRSARTVVVRAAPATGEEGRKEPQ